MFDKNFKAQKHLETLTRQKERDHQNLKTKLIKSKRVAISIPPIYRRRLGENLPLTLGVETITIPVDGKTYMVPEGFAEVLQKHLHQINIEELRSQGAWGTERGDVGPTGPVPGLNK